MDHIPDQELPAVSEAAHAAAQEAMDAGVFVFAGGVHDGISVVTSDGTVTEGVEDKAHIGGLTIVDVPSYDDAVEWAAKFAAACRCAQELREIMADHAVGN
jgi:hypothetical protein